MKLKGLMTLVLALALAGCDAWTAKAQLLPTSARDSIGLAGQYSSAKSELRVTPLGNRRYAMSLRQGDNTRTTTASFDLLRTDPIGSAQDGDSYTKYYLVEYERKNDNGEVSYAYDVVSTEYSDEYPDPQLGHYSVICSEAAARLAASSESACEFSSYRAVRAAALDMLGWLDEARAEVKLESFYRPSDDS
ncbi:hypothetical protein [Pontixanthobacter sp. CEM42]|uniref:hypothetical protein n=1 Tax=Pontixanthobacter sp. CEM42 TaxID=2792077 RepID=UPI001AE0CFBF|nr:hypothetical protein [Pontixanthobacter sp. CEM42]